jgi:glyoxylase-like metal-dependent hydrolase (beta-lactamase superfamily II)
MQGGIRNMFYDYGDEIYGVDSGYLGSGIAAVYIVLDNGRAAIVDVAHNESLKPTLEAMSELGVARGSVDYILITHVHLDHAGGAGLYMKEFPNAKLVVHSRGARHMIDPSKLVAGADAIYGTLENERRHGKLIPVPEERIIAPKDEDEIVVGSRVITCHDTLGHAKHHLAYLDHRAKAVFTGDSFGVFLTRYGKVPDLPCLVVPTTSPVQFDPDAMITSIDRIVGLNPKRLFLPHYGELRDVQGTAADLRRLVHAHTKIALESGGDIDKIKAALIKLFFDEANSKGYDIPGEVPELILPVLEMYVDLNAYGLLVWYNKLQGENAGTQ